MGSRRLRNSFIYLLITVAIVAIVVNLLSNAVGDDREIGINDVIAMTARGQVDIIEVKGDSLTLITTSGETLTSRKESGSSIVEILQRGGVDLATSNVEIIPKGQSGLSSILSVLFNFLPLIFFGAILSVHDEERTGEHEPDVQLRSESGPDVHGKQSPGELRRRGRSGGGEGGA